jgi:hypothetical protein
MTLQTPVRLPSADPKNKSRQDEATQHWIRHAKPLPPSLIGPYDALRRDGIVKIDWHTLGLPSDLLTELIIESEHVHTKKSDHLEQLNAADQGKTYWHKLLGDRDIVSDGQDIFARVALSEPLLLLAGHYFGVSPWLMEYNLWLNTIEPGAPRASQLWHRDTEIASDGRFVQSFRSIVKGFVYLHEVTPAHGPTSYVKETQVGGKVSDLALVGDLTETNGAIRYFDDTIAYNKELAKRSITADGPRGTVILFDASGIHKGGKPLSSSRLLYKFELGDWLWRGFPYPKLHWRFTDDVATRLSPLARFAIEG